MSVLEFVRGQFTTLPYPGEDCSGRTIVVTGANSGLGLEAAKHFVRLNASKVILGCRNLDKAASAKQVIEESTKRQGVVELWQVDLSSFESVKEFATRVNKLDRLDIFVNNASILAPVRVMADGHESQITVNVISTLLLSVLVLPSLRRSAMQFNMTPHLVTVASDGAFLAHLPEQKEENIFQALDAKENVMDQYPLSKLLQLMFLVKLAEAVDTSGKGHIIVNALNPGFCKTQLFRQYSFPISLGVRLFSAVFAREPEMGSRTLLAAAFAGEETHGKYMSDCKVHYLPKIMTGDDGEKLTERVWDELLEIIEGIESGVTQNI